jgi:Na+/H+ antiporter NhaC
MQSLKINALAPFGIFLLTFILLNSIYNQPEIVRDNFPIFAAFIAIIASFFTFRKDESLNDKVTLFIQGATQNIVVHMGFIFYVSTVFTAILEKTGGIQAAVNLSLLIIPSWCILPGMFIVTSLFSFTVGTSMGAIAAFMPIAGNIAFNLAINPSLMAATIVCGAMFGDNLSILSDTTIASVQITGANMKEKLLLNTKIAAPAFLFSLCMLAYQNFYMTTPISHLHLHNFSIIDSIKLLPYLATFYLALTGLDILIVMTLGILLACGFGLALNTITPLQAINLFFDGFYTSKGMVNVFILVLLLSGLSKIISYNGGIDLIITQLQQRLQNKNHGKLAMYALISIINMTIAINTIAILITGPIASEIGKTYDIEPAQTACILDIGSCVSQGILPYAPQILLAACMAHVSTISLLPFLYYQYCLGISLLVFILAAKK